MPKLPIILKSPFPIFLVLVLFFWACQQTKTSKATLETTATDSIQIWLDQSQVSETPKEIKSDLLAKAQKSAFAISNDSLKSSYLTKLSIRYLSLRDSINFRNVNREAIRFNKSIGDSANLGEVYWDLGAFYKRHNIQDSAYFQYREAQQVFEAINDQFRSGQLLRSIANLQSDIGDNITAEATVIRAIEKLKPLNEYRALASCYDLLADNAKLLNEPERALSHYKESLAYKQKANESSLRLLSTKHNMALVYQKQGQHQSAIATFLEVLAYPNLRQEGPSFYGRVLNNLGYSYLKSGQYDSLPNLFMTARKIQDSINDVSGKSSGALKLAEYYLTQKDSLNALSNLQMAHNLALEAGDKKQLLNVLRMLPTADPKNATNYTQQYVTLNDSLLLQERQIRNKFARIRFETDEFIAENEVLAREKQLWTGIAASLILLGLAGYIIISQRIKNRNLKFRQEQQASNQEIFNLMLAQGEKVEEGKKMEQKRVSEELHDGVLGKMLGARMMLLGLNKKTDPEAVAERAKAISILQDVEGEVRSISHELSHAAYQKIHNFILSIKDLTKTIQSASKINIDFKFTDELDWDALSGEIKINLYRMVQESIQNSVKHADCQNISMHFYADEAMLTVDIADDGKGFVPKRGKKGIGMRNMSSRIKKVNGTWDIKSEVGKGTTVTFVIPLVSNDSENAPSISPIEHNLQET
ncbi:MAG: ATP-binding protein [Maribacter sp.]|uniref:tetratricopeptide repeat-containing sensor histidine kinase n=1 Tax=Maribacter sp. TaxID=1897614 RepID=UPI003297C833